MTDPTGFKGEVFGSQQSTVATCNCVDVGVQTSKICDGQHSAVAFYSCIDMGIQVAPSMADSETQAALNDGTSILDDANSRVLSMTASHNFRATLEREESIRKHYSQRLSSAHADLAMERECSAALEARL